MFNNKFLKHDPLVEAVKQAQADGELRRQAEALVNEEFGVYSRQAVVRENLAAYDAAIEEAYKCMKEAEKADKDYDKDGKIESPKDEVWGSRFRAAKKAGKMEEGAVDAGSMEGSKSVTQARDPRATSYDKTLPKTYPGAASSAPTAARLSNAKAAVTPIKEEGVTAPKEWAMKAKTPNKNAVTKAPVPGVSIAEDNLDEVSKGAAIRAYRGKESETRDSNKLMSLIHKKWGKETSRHAERAGVQDTIGLQRKGESHGTDRLARAKPSSEMRKTKSGKIHKQDVESKKSEIKFRKSMSKFDAKRGHLPEEHLDEERKRTASVADAFLKGQKANQRTLRTDGKSVTYHGNTIAKHEGDEVHVTTAGHSLSPSTRGHINGILSRLGSDKLSVKKGQLHHGKNPVDSDAWIKVKKSTVSEESINEAAYSAKSARAGKDIGKPGKMFAKIAAKAGERYGSEERGKKVAGAILKKIRAKHMEEETRIDELSAFGAEFAKQRASGAKQFSFGGKTYSTALKGQTGAKPSGPQNNPGLAGAKGFPTRDVTPLPTRSPEQQQAKVDASAVRANKSAIPNPTIGTPNSRGGVTQSAVGAGGEVTPGSSADYAQKNGMTSAKSGGPNIGTGTATSTVKDINKDSSALASVNAANKAAPSTMDTVKSTVASAGSSIDKATGGLAGKAYDAAASGVNKVKSAVGMNEEVTVGDNKYRIV